MNKPLSLALCLLSLAGLCSCHSDEFKIEARVSGLGTQNVRLTYATAEGVQSDWVTAQDDRISYTGYAPDLTVVDISASMGTQIIRLAVRNGDKLQFRGMLGDPFSFEVRGSGVNTRWLEFRASLRDAINRGEQATIDKAIVQYIRDNPKDELSLLLLLYDYGSLRDRGATDKLIALIDDKAKPAYLLATYNALSHRQALNHDRDNRFCSYFSLPDSNGDWTPWRASDKSYTAIYLWSTNDNGRSAIVDSLKKIEKNARNTRFRVVDVLVDADTTLWRSRWRRDSTTWKHYWLPGGPENPFTSNLRAFSTPQLMLVDSMGERKYTGPAVSALKRALQADLSKPRRARLTR